MAFPNVPNVPGVPPLPRSPGQIEAAVTLLANDILGLLGISLDPEWGIFDQSGLPVVIANSVVSMGFHKDWTVANYPLEQGAFEPYDKVEMPFETRMRFTSDGSESERVTLLESIEAVAGTVDVYDVVTPERVYTSVNIVSYDYQREAARGLGLMIVDVVAMEVRIKATANFTKSASSSDTLNKGQLTATPATGQQTTQLNGYLAGAL